MKRTMPWSEQIDVISSDESSSSSDADDDIEEMTNDALDGLNLSFDTPLDHTFKEITPHGLVIKRAEMYQNYMRQLPMPPHHGSVIPFSSWVGLGKSIKQLYGQPLHYLTNVLLKQWDLQRLDDGGRPKPLDIIIHPCKAEASIWLVEEIHRRTLSHHHLAKLWLADPMHHMFVDSIFPQL